MKKWLKQVGLIVTGLLLILAVLPYFFPVTKAIPHERPTPFSQSVSYTVDGIDLHTRQWMPKEESVRGHILLIHGLGGSTFSWRHTVEPLWQAGYQVVAVDLPGFGYSDRSRGIDHSQEERSRLLWMLLDEIGPAQRWILLGHSMGGGTAAAMAMERPLRVEALVWVAGALHSNDRGPVSLLLQAGPVARWGEILIQSLIINRNRIASSLQSAYGRDPSEEEIMAHLKPLERPGTSGVLVDLVRTAQSRPLKDLEKTTIPILGVWGRLDSWVPLEEGEAIQERLPWMELVVIEGAYHCPMETHPEAFNRILLNFMEVFEEDPTGTLGSEDE